MKNNIGGKLSAEGISHAKCGEFPLRIGFSPRKPVFACPCCYFLRRLKDLHFKLKKKIAYNWCYIALPDFSLEASFELQSWKNQDAGLRILQKSEKLWRRHFFHNSSNGGKSNAEDFSHAKCGENPLWAGFRKEIRVCLPLLLLQNGLSETYPQKNKGKNAE